MEATERWTAALLSLSSLLNRELEQPTAAADSLLPFASPLSALLSCSLDQASECDSQRSELMAVLAVLVARSCRGLQRRRAEGAGAGQEAELRAVRRLWRLLRNEVTRPKLQSAFLSSPSFPLLHSALTAMAEGGGDVALLAVGLQLVANTVTGNRETASAYLSRHLLSEDFLSLLSSSRRLPAAVRSCLLLVLHTVTAEASSQRSLISHRLGPAVLLAALQPLPAPLPAGDDGDCCELLRLSLLRRFFLHQEELLPVLCILLYRDGAGQPLQAEADGEADAQLSGLLTDLLTLEADELGSALRGQQPEVSAVTANCSCALQLLSARHAQPAAVVAAELQDDALSLTRIPTTLRADALTHAALLLLEHVLALALSLADDASAAARVPDAAAALVALFRSPERQLLLLSLLASSDTPVVRQRRTAAARRGLQAQGQQPASSASTSVPFAFQSDLLRLLSLLSSGTPPPPLPVLTALSLLAHTRIHPEQPLQREYALLGLSSLCRLQTVSSALTELQAEDVEGREEWRQQGLDVSWDQQRGRVRVATSRDSSPV